MSDSDGHEKDREALVGTATPHSCGTPGSLDQWDAAQSQFITTPGVRLSTHARIPYGEDHNGAEKYVGHERRSQRFELLEEIESIFRNQVNQLNKASTKTAELETQLRREHYDSLLLATHTLTISIAGMQKVLEGNFVIIDKLGVIQELHEASKTLGYQLPVSFEALDDVVGDTTEVCDEVPDLLADHSSYVETNWSDFDYYSTSSMPAVRGSWNISSPGSDVFLDTYTNPQPVTLSNSLQLEFHPDIINLKGHKIYAAFKSDEKSPAPYSRRVVLYNLPPDVTLAQVAVAVREFGGIIKISLLKTSAVFGNTMSALLEFVYADGAAAYVNAVQSSRLIFETCIGAGGMYCAGAWLIPTRSYICSTYDFALSEKGQTRTLILEKFSQEAIWYFICAAGIDHLVHVNYDAIAEELRIEFASLFHAGRVNRLILNGMFQDIGKTTMGNSRNVISCRVAEEPRVQRSAYQDELIPYISPKALAGKWDCKPFNSYWPTVYKPVMKFQQLSPRSPRSPLPSCHSTKERLALQHDIEKNEVDYFLNDLDSYEEDTEYRIVGSRIALKRRKWGWSITEEDETKLLMANTLQDPEWAGEWDEYFRSKGAINLRTWERYGILAKHRREKATEQGIEPWMVPKCEGCDMGCCNLKETPIPEVVKKYTELPKPRIVNTE